MCVQQHECVLCAVFVVLKPYRSKDATAFIWLTCMSMHEAVGGSYVS